MIRKEKGGTGGYTRREVLSALTAVGVGGTLAGCGVVTQQSSRTHKKSASVPAISFPRSAKRSAASASFEWMDSCGLKALFEQPMFTAYQKAYPNIHISYQNEPWATINQAVPLGVRNGNAPDIFQMPQTVPPQIAVNQGWVAPLDEIIPDFKKWQSAYPSSAFIPGVHIFNGHMYAWTFTSSRSQYSMLLAYDVEYMKRADLNPANPRFTWKEFRAACKKITQQGNGQYYGMVISGDNLGADCLALAQMAGARGGEFDWKTGQYNYTRPELLAGIELLLSIKSDGSILPGFLSLNDAAARSRMPVRNAGMIFDGPWDIPAWPQANPAYDFGIAPTPTPDGKAHPFGYQEGTAAPLWVFSGSKNKDIAGDLLSYMGGVAGQKNLIIYTQGNFLSEIPSVNTDVRRSGLLKGKALKASEIMQSTMRIEPIVETRNAETAQVILAEKPVVPSLSDVAKGIFSGQITDIKGALKSLQDRSEQNLDDAIKAAQAKGANVSRDDWKFPNWDPTKDYTVQDYKALH